MDVPRRARAALAAAAVALLPVSPAVGADRHAGYYYPVPATEEVYESRTAPLPDSNRRRRVLFVTALTNQMMDAAYPPPFAIFAKGEEAEKLILTSLYAGSYDTVYRMRGLLAMLTAKARSTPIFREMEVEDRFTFLDLLRLLGFRRLTLTDGDRFAHRVRIE